ncbi:unnamed protein product [Amoebophrya sp. A25]|nr:unnamed protein product [Amoebophrya sp. A25]|eukprot:GSA25T00026838001.1
MTEYWVSTAKHYCKVCKIWISGHKRNITVHNGSKFHLENEKKMLKEGERRLKEEQKEEKEAARILAEMERAADNAMGFVSSSSTGGAASSSGGPLTQAEINARYEATVIGGGSSSSSSGGKNKAGGFGGGGGGNKGMNGKGKGGGGGGKQKHNPNFIGLGGNPDQHHEDGGGPNNPIGFLQAQIARKQKELKEKIKKDWVVCHDAEEEKNYYFNVKTQKRQWDRPKGLDAGDLNEDKPMLWVAIEVKKEEKEALEQEQDDDEAAPATYYYNTQTGETTWERPEKMEWQDPSIPDGWEVVEEKESVFAKRKSKRQIEEDERAAQKEREIKRAKFVADDLLENSTSARGAAHKSSSALALSTDGGTELDGVAEMRDAARRGGVFSKEDFDLDGQAASAASVAASSKATRMFGSRAGGGEQTTATATFFNKSKKIRGGGNRRQRTEDDD